MMEFVIFLGLALIVSAITACLMGSADVEVLKGASLKVGIAMVTSGTFGEMSFLAIFLAKDAVNTGYLLTVAGLSLFVIAVGWLLITLGALKSS